MAQSHLIPHNRPYVPEVAASSVADLVKAGQWAQGSSVTTLESELAQHSGWGGCKLVSSGMTALVLGLRELGVKAGSRVAIPAYSCVALPNSVLSLGADIVPVDIAGDSFNIDLSQVPDDVDAVIGVNTFGFPINWTPQILDNFITIEDASHGYITSGVHSARPNAMVLSLYATKYLGGGEGGAILSGNGDLLDRIEGSKDYADKPMSPLGLNHKMTNLCAEIVRCQLLEFEHLAKLRHQLVKSYTNSLKSAGLDQYLVSSPNSQRQWYRYCIRVPGEIHEEVRQYLLKHNISSHKPVEWWLEKNSIKFPNAFNAFEQLLSLPFFPDMKEEEVYMVTGVLRDVLGEYT